MTQITIYKASAGSGKTWRLSVEFIKLLIRRPESYQNILAVTFTNKATTEMKQRILDDLQMLAFVGQNKEHPVLKTLEKELGLSQQEISRQAEKALSLLLHDYSRFRVETIDSFFQSILRNLARELGLGTSMNIELDVDDVLQEAVDSMIEKAGENKELLQWLEDYIEENLLEGRDRKVAAALKEFGKTIFMESFQSREQELRQILSDKSFLNTYRNQLIKHKNQAAKELREMGQHFFDLLQQHHLEVDDLSSKKSGVAGYFVKLLNENFDKDIVGKRVEEALYNPEKWATAKHPRYSEIIALADQSLIPCLQSCENKRPGLFSTVFSCELCLKHLYKIGLLTDIAKEVRAINREQNRFFLSDTAVLLQTLINDSDTSFVYEKAGTELQHIMIDEFQDTSRIQWANFRPLIFEGLSKGFDSLLVGDEKQSIYRWRNSDWRILANLDKELAPIPLRFQALSYNFRSEQRIVQFNNALFRRAADLSADLLEQELGKACPEIARAYTEIEQLSPLVLEEGWVKTIFIKDDDRYYQRGLEHLVHQSEYLQAQGVRPDQIAIIIRKNKHIPEIAAFFAQYQLSHADSPYCYTIVSDEAFRLDASPAIRVLIAALRLLSDPLDKIARVELEQAWSNVLPNLSKHLKEEHLYELPAAFETQLTELVHIPLFELAGLLLRIFHLEKIPAQESYLFSFMDKLQDFLEKIASDLSSFLRYWDDKLCKTTLPKGSSMNGIRITSIHKSKGLQYHSVIVAFCDWAITSKGQDQVWCHTEQQPYAALPLIPVDYQQSMNLSVFKDDYQEETIQQYVDNLNLLYVAFTRAEKNLLICCKAPKKKKEDSKETKAEIKASPKNVSELIYQLLSDKEHPLFSAHFVTEEDEAGFEFGRVCTDIAAEEGQESIRDFAVPYRTFPHKTGFRQSNPSRDFVLDRESGEFHNAYIDRGKLMHKLFSRIGRKEDAKTAVHSLVTEGLLSEQEEPGMLSFVQEALNQPVAGEWYSGEYRLYNECIILYRDAAGKLSEKRPDRVIRRNNKVEVIDFKFGKAVAKYHKQVAQYMQLLRQMGHKQVEGYLWYVDEQRVEKVELREEIL